MKLEIIDSGQPLSEADLDEIQDDIRQAKADQDWVFPEQYRDFLLRHNGGQFAQPVDFDMAEAPEKGTDSFSAFFSLRRGEDGWIGWGSPGETEPEWWDVVLLGIGSDAFGCEFCIAHTGEHRGRIFYVNSVSDYKVFFVAETFNEFLESFRVSSEYEPVEPEGPLRCAETGDLAALRHLLESETDIESCNLSGQTLLSIAARNGRPAVVRDLVNRGANLESKDQSGDTPLAHAVREKWIDCTRLLLDAGANPNTETSRGQRVLFDAIHEYANERTAILLIEAGADVNAPNAKGETPLSACVWCWHIGGLEIFNVLRAYGADPDAAIPPLAALIRSDNTDDYMIYGTYDTRPNAMKILAEMKAVDTLFDLIRDGFISAAWSLSSIAPESMSELAEILRHWIATSDDEHVRTECVNVLEYCEPSSENRQIVMDALNDPSEFVRGAAESTLERWDNPD